MKIAYFSCFAGIAGDMTIGALLDAGLEFEFLEHELAKLGIDGYSLRHAKVQRHHISGTKFDVLLDSGAVPFHTHDADDPQSGSEEHRHEHAHEQRQGHEHEHGAHNHGHEQAAEHAHDGHARHVHRSLSDIVKIIEASALSPEVKERSIRIFARLGQAESRMHDIPVEKVHFHEVGGVDAILDIVGACIGIEALGIDAIYSSPVRVGTGTIQVAHGTMPVPAPGTLELLRGVPVEHTNIPYELVTPTGAAILTTLAEHFGAPPVFVPDLVGYGAGGRDPEQIANLLRVEIGEPVAAPGVDEVVVIETNIDDMTPEVYGYLIERLFAAGAKDVFLTPVIMKKNRPGIVVTAVADERTQDRVTDVIFRETSTLGVRMSRSPRRILRREVGTVETPWGPVRVKRAEWNGEVRITPEYDDCAEIARKHDVPVLRVYSAVRTASKSA